MYNEFIYIIIWFFVMGGLSYLIPTTRMETVNGIRQTRTNTIFAIALFLPVIFLAANRAVNLNIGDTSSYIEMAKSLPSTFVGVRSYLETVTKDRGFVVLGIAIKSIFGDSTFAYFGILALIQGGSLIYVYRKYSTNYFLSMLLFMLSTDYVSWMFNGIRQFTAATIIFAATPLMLKKKWIQLIIIILVASTIHQSALLMIPVVFIVQGKAWNSRTLLVILASVGVIFFAEQFTGLLETMLSDTQYTNVVSDWETFNDNGTNWLRVIVYAVPTILSLVGRKWILEEEDPIINLAANMSIISTALYIVSTVTSGIFIGRLPIYMSLYNYILLPYLIDRIFTKNSAALLKTVMILLYLLFYYYQMHVSWGLL